MTTKTMRFAIGEQLEYRGDAHLMVVVNVLDSRMAYGREQYSITPICGAGQRWVDVVTLVHEPKEKTI